MVDLRDLFNCQLEERRVSCLRCILVVLVVGAVESFAAWPANGQQISCEPVSIIEELGEKKAEGEDDTIKALAAMQVKIMEATDPTKRGQHPKHHGCVEATFIVREDIPEEYRV